MSTLDVDTFVIRYEDEPKPIFIKFIRLKMYHGREYVMYDVLIKQHPQCTSWQWN